MSRVALIAGRGGLPAALVAMMPDRPLVAALEGFAPGDLRVDLTFRVERLVPFLKHLLDLGVDR
ncbi:MAG: LpxI family protein, partial [Paracoccaceae bacterium]|nr:LpxI family protein [Paracoccaceae bacterium]